MKKGNTKKKNEIVFFLFSLVLGMLMGWIASDFSNIGMIGAMAGNIGIWIFISALLALYTPESMRAALHVLAYFAGVIAAYFGRCALLGDMASLGTLFYWSVLAVIGAVIGFVDWHAYAKEWLGAFCAAVPIALLAAEAYPIHQGFSWLLMIDVIFAVILYAVMAPGRMQKLMALPFIIVFTFALVYFDVLSGVLGGWI